MEASALKYQAGIGLHGRSPLLRLQSDERLITLLRRGNTAAFEVLVARYETRLLAFCRHLLGSREDAEDVLQEVMTAAFNAIVADDRPISARPWLYRIARNRSLNHMRRTQAIGVDSMDHHLSDHGASTADKVHEREDFRMLVGDIQELPETQRTALVLREMDALSYEQIAEAMETTVSSVKSLLVRARMGLAEAAEARILSCDEVRIQLAEVAEGLLKKPSPLVRRHLKDCSRCGEFRTQLKATNKALAALLPVGPLVVFRKLAFLHLGHSGAAAGAGAGSTATATAASSGAGAAIGASGMFGGSSVISAGIGAVATKAAAGLAAAVIVTAGAVEVSHSSAHPAAAAAAVAQTAPSPIAPVHPYGERPSTVAAVSHTQRAERQDATAAGRATARRQSTTTAHVTAVPTTTTPATTVAATATSTQTSTVASAAPATPTAEPTTTTPAGPVQTQTNPTILPPTTTPAPPIVTPTAPVQPVTAPPTPITTTTTTVTTTTTTSPTTTAPTTTTGPTTTEPTTTTTPTTTSPTTTDPTTTTAQTTTQPTSTTTSTPTP
jgi:RNA polymerase sigma factor (sigma-70 family)